MCIRDRTSKSTITFSANEGQTSFAGTYVAGAIDVYLNGVRLSDSEYVGTSATNIVLNDAANAGDVLDLVKFDFGNAIKRSAGGSRNNWYSR